MTGPNSARLNYAIYRDASRTLNWGNTIGTDANSFTGTGSSQNIYIYPSIAAGQFVAPGTYTDTITYLVTGSGGTASGSFTVTATVLSTCSFFANTLAFGGYTGAQSDAASGVTVTCSNTTTYNIGIQTGLHGGGANFDWELLGPSPYFNKLSYKIFRDSARTTYWGGTPGYDTVNGTGNGSAQLYTVYGRIAAGQSVAPGAYSDTIQFTLYY